MRITISVLMAVLLTANLWAEEPYFPIKEGAVLTYAEKNPKGKVQSYVAYTINDVSVSDNKIMVAYAINVMDAAKKQTMEPMSTTITIEDGSVHFDATSAIAQLTEGMEIKGHGIILPLNMSVGDRLDDYNVSIPNLGLNSQCTNIRVTNQETLTVEAGTFDCVKVMTDVATKVMFINTNGVSAVWYARGIGEIKSETYDKKGKLISVRELVAIN